jgi:hypothetical protein
MIYHQYPEESEKNYIVNQLTPWSRVLLEEQIITQLVNKFLAFHGTQHFTTVKMAVFWVVAPCSLAEVY